MAGSSASGPPGPDVSDVAARLYGLPPGEFTAARDAEAAAARKEGDKERAAAVKALRRPTAAAWAVNVLVRERPADVDRLLALGSALREAQASLAGDALRRLSAERQEVVAALARAARELAAAAGQPVGGPSLDEIEETLETALADPGAAEAVRTGRLTTALERGGSGLGAASGMPGPTSRQDEEATARVERERRSAARARERAEATLERRRAQLTAATKGLEAARRAVEGAERALHAAKDAFDAADDELRAARADESRAGGPGAR